MRLRIAAALLLALASGRAAAKCTPADPREIAAAEAKAAEAERRAQNAESIAVRSGNGGAHARAIAARAAAAEAQAEVERLRCGKAGEPAPIAPLPDH
jgi:hypothetical protein